MIESKQSARPDWSDYDFVMVRAMKESPDGPKFTTPRPQKAANGFGSDLLRIEINRTVSMGEAAKILREIARDFAETDRFMHDAPAFVDHVLPIPRKGRQ